MASLPCRICGLDTVVSIGYVGTFVKCIICRNLNNTSVRPKKGPRLDTEEGMRAMADELIAEIDSNKDSNKDSTKDSKN
jgi:hypothetical protein